MIRKTVLFGGYDASGAAGLWATNGTAAGTYELTGIGTNSTSTPPVYFAAFNGEVFYRGPDASGAYGLWATDGTAAGTIEIGGIANSGVSGAGSNGLDPTSLTVLDTVNELTRTVSETLFFVSDFGLWVTNGTAAGTVELGGVESEGISGAYSAGLNPSNLIAYFPNFIVSDVLFAGKGASGALGLWVTN
jgi:ELWxxDGT repeat protein